MNHPITRRLLLRAAAVCAAGGSLAESAAAADFPTKAIRLVVPFTAGGPADSAARIIAQPLTEALGQPVLVDNRPGGDGSIAAVEVARAAPDGHTLLLATPSALNYVPAIHVTRPPYDPLKDFLPVSCFTSFTYFLFVHRSVPVDSMQQLIDYARTHPRQLAYGTGDSTSIIAMAQVQMSADIEMIHVPYKGGAQIVNDFMAGRVHLTIGTIDLIDKFRSQGKPLAVLLPERSVRAPDLPTFSEVGLPQVNLLPWTGFFAPARTPAPVVARLSREMVLVFERPELKEIFSQNGNILAGSSPEALETLLKTQLAAWREAVRFAKLPTI